MSLFTERQLDILGTFRTKWLSQEAQWAVDDAEKMTRAQRDETIRQARLFGPDQRSLTHLILGEIVEALHLHESQPQE